MQWVLEWLQSMVSKKEKKIDTIPTQVSYGMRKIYSYGMRKI